MTVLKFFRSGSVGDRGVRFRVVRCFGALQWFEGGAGGKSGSLWESGQTIRASDVGEEDNKIEVSLTGSKGRKGRGQKGRNY